jgi:hypothetical protein
VLRRSLIAALGAYLLILGIGIAAFLSTDTVTPFTPAVAANSELLGDRVNWASLQSGARVRASGWEHFRSHHPLYLIDEEPDPSHEEKWASPTEQRFPWFEVVLDGERDIDVVTLRHGGWREGAEYTNDRYIIRCYRGDTLVSEVGILDNTAPVAEHDLACPAVDRIHVSFDCSGRVDVARIYEIEAWGDGQP